jgi:Ca2+-binding RTX toxin-like protein
MQSIQLDGRDGESGRVLLDLTTGKLSSDIEIHVFGDEDDVFEIKGSALADNIRLDGDVITCAGSSLEVHLHDVSRVTLRGFAGNDTLQVLGDQTGRQVTLAGEAGNDCFVIASFGGEITVTDSSGLDKLDFSLAEEALVFDCSVSQQEVVGNTLRVNGAIETVIGTEFDDVILGNSKSGAIYGRGGNDLLRGGGGNDNLYGEAGDDWLYGDAGNDCLIGGEGDDLLSGGSGVDKLVGEDGFDFAIGGAGVDTIDARGGNDLVVSGRTAFDNDHEALLAILAEWTSGRPLAARIANLTDGTGSPDRENEDFFLFSGPGGTLLKDGTVNLIRTILVNSGNWILSQPGDVVLRR